MLGWFLFAASMLGIGAALIGCVGDVEVRSGGNMACDAPAYGIQAFSCDFDLTCNAKGGLDVANANWECWCNVIPKRETDLRLECSLTSSTVEQI
jgi:hypothetical protein